MHVQRIASIVLAQPAPARASLDSAVRPLAAGDTLRMTVSTAAGNGVLAAQADGLQLQLAGLGNLASGDVLVLKVLAVTPKLELALVSAPLPRDGRQQAGEQAEPAAMQLDQLALLRQSVARNPDALALAASWRAMVLGYLERQLAVQEQARGQRLPASVFQSGAAAAALHALSAPPPAIGNWLFAAYAWGDQRVVLQVLATEDENPPSKRRRGTVALRLQLVLPGLGLVTVQMQLAAGGVWLDLAADRVAGRECLRGMLRQIAAAVACADLRIVRCRLAEVLPDAAPAGIAPVRTLSPALFRAAAEVVVLLSAPLY